MIMNDYEYRSAEDKILEFIIKNMDTLTTLRKGDKPYLDDFNVFKNSEIFILGLF